jgi:hypothetical protein
MTKKTIAKNHPHQELNILMLLLLFSLPLFATYFAYFSTQHLIPVHDGSNCVARVANLSISLYHLDWIEFWRKLWSEKNTFLSSLYFSSVALLAAPGRMSFGLGWSISLLFTGFLHWKILKKKISDSKIILSILLLFAATAPICTQYGGLWDQRMDLFSILLITLSISSIYANQVSLWIIFTLLGVLAKGPALPVVGLLILSTCLTGVVKLKEIKNDLQKNKLLSTIGGCLICVYIVFFLGAVVTYNTTYSTMPSSYTQPLPRFLHFLSVAPLTVWRDKRFYFADLYHENCFSLIPILGGLFLIGKGLLERSLERSREMRYYYWGLLCFLAIYTVFSAHPVKSKVITVWLAVPLWVLCLNFSAAFGSLRKYQMFCSVLFILSLALSAERVRSTMQRMTLMDRNSLITMKSHVSLLANQLKGISTSTPDTPPVLRIWVNFLYSPNGFSSFNYDAYRVLMFEALQRSSPIIEGWEFGSRNGDWQDMAVFAHANANLLVLAEQGEPRIHFAGLNEVIFNDVQKNVKRNCEVLGLASLPYSEMGRMRAFLLANKITECWHSGQGNSPPSKK